MGKNNICHGKDSHYLCFFIVGILIFFTVFYLEYNRKRLLASNNLKFKNDKDVINTSSDLQPASNVLKLSDQASKKQSFWSHKNNNNKIITDEEYMKISGKCITLSGVRDGEYDQYRDRICNMLSTERSYVIGKWIKNCNKSLALEKQTQLVLRGSKYTTVENPFAVDPFVYANYFRSVTGSPSNINRIWDTGDRARVCYGPETMKAVPKVYKQKIRSLFYTWKPAACLLREFKANDMLAVFKKKIIVFVGDSIMKQFVNSLWSLTRVRAAYVKANILFNDRTLKPMDSIELKLCEQCKRFKQFQHEDKAHPCELQTRFCPTDGSISPEYQGAYNDWSRFLPDADVFVINMGAHLHNIFPYLASGATLEIIANNLAKFIAKSNFKGLLIWLKTPLYQPSCDGATKPREMNEGSYKYNASDAMLHSWDLLQKQQKLGIFEKAFKNRKELEGRFVVLDSGPTNLRIDQHPGKNNCKDCSDKYSDCLHFCYPGGSDVWVHFLYNILDQYFASANKNKK